MKLHQIAKVKTISVEEIKNINTKIMCVSK